MSDDNKELPQIPNESMGESILGLTKSVIDSIQILISPLGAASNIAGAAYDKLRYERLQKGITDFAKFSGKISDKVLQLEEFKDAFYMALNNYVEAPSAKVREIVSSLNQSLFEKLSVNENDPTHLFDNFILFSMMLRQLSFPALYCTKNFEKQFGGRKATRFQIVNYLEETFHLSGKRAFMELVNNSIIQEEGTKEQPPSFGFLKNNQREEKALGDRIYELQHLGVIFADWINAKGNIQKDGMN